MTSAAAASAAARERMAGIGVIEWLRIGDVERVTQLIEDMRELRVRRLRTQFSWADWHAPGGEDWYSWLLPRLAAECEVLPCFTYTPPSLGIEARTASPPRDPKAYADFLDLMITRFGAHFEWVELWNEPNNLNDWDWHLDHNWEIFSSMVGQAAYWVRQRGKKTLLGGMCPTDPNWLGMLADRGVLEHIDAVGIHGFPGTWDFRERSWSDTISDVRAVLEQHAVKPQIWLTEVGYSTWRHDEIEQLRQLRTVLDAPADRIYWYAANDLHDSLSHQDGFHEDERHYHFGLRDAHGRPKLLYRMWAASGFDGVEEIASLQHHHGTGLSRAPDKDPVSVASLAALPPERQRADDADQTASAPEHDTARQDTPAQAPQRPPARLRSGQQRPVLITGGAGFVGTNLAARLLAADRPVLIYDNLSRPGVEHNVRWLRACFGDRLQVEIADVRDRHLLREAVAGVGQVFHFAAQVAVTSSLEDPATDFDINLRGTFNVLEAARRARRPPPVVFTSTNKVYGAIDDVALEATDSRYQPRDAALRAAGIGESRPLDFHSPYGCSKGGADQYVLDYARSYGLPAAVLRMSCIYGPHQFGTEDQGWVAHFLIRALERQPITIYGDGRQVRDILFVEDLVDALLLCQERMPQLRGRAFNIGGGPANTTSLIELLERIGALAGHTPKVTRAPWRTGDQRYYVSDTRALGKATGWAPRVGVADGVARLHHWLHAQRSGSGQIPARRHVA
ncbi:NAD-dependent epimerase/dehydratase family protein [Lysobacter sp. D1-1-M9]|uniref:NAD-dependent epimerase/dehydratase family protein n=1 Tax=Novilysobacter longmucuonensis TaxID=3098603 RepID=UPI002FC9D500